MSRFSKSNNGPKIALRKDGDDLGPYPGDVDNEPTQQRILERALRNVSIATLVSGMMNIALIMTLVTLFPLQKVQPYLVTFKDQNQQVVGIEPLAMNAPGILYMTEDNVRDYVVQRHRFVPIATQMEAQWGKDSRLAARTEKELYDKFAQSSKLELEKLMTGGYNREIKIETVNRLSEDTWQVGFKTFDSMGGKNGTLTGDPAQVLAKNAVTDQRDLLQADLTPTVATQNWVATMRVEYKPSEVTYDKRLLNPLGFTITDYAVTARK
jgi:type IV secretory pathway component VirB8